jgi:hypothetical protein
MPFPEEVLTITPIYFVKEPVSWLKYSCVELNHLPTGIAVLFNIHTESDITIKLARLIKKLISLKAF